MPSHRYHSEIHMHDVDAAGLLFFAHQFRLMHEAYESLLRAGGLPLGEQLKHHHLVLPIVHAEGDYFAPLYVSDRIDITIGVSHIGTTSFSFSYEIFRGEDKVGAGRTVHVATDRNTRQKMPIPDDLRKLLERFAI